MTPTHTRVRMYQVGFGDCFLITFTYARPLPDERTERHILIDFGSTYRLKDGPTLADTAQLITEHTGGQLDVLVVTHRHKDHLGGFGDTRAGALIDDLHPRLILRPWTDDPAIADDATAPPSTDQRERRRRYIQGLRTGQRVAQAITETLQRDSPRLDGRTRAGELAAAAGGQTANHAALARLDAYAQAPGARAIYASYGTIIPLEELIPGVTCDVLGPPTIDMAPDVVRQTSTAPQEFWLGPVESAASLPIGQIRADGDEWDPLAPPDGLGSARWLLERLQSHQQSALQRLVELVDNAINNTSLILLFTVGGSRRLLFPGDTQIENWQFALGQAEKDPALRHRLERCDLYKVGHHGSRNATPKSLFRLWTQPKVRSHPMTALMSTLPGPYGKTADTAVPRQTLVDALNGRMDLYRTDRLGTAGFVEVVAPTVGDGGFALADP